MKIFKFLLIVSTVLFFGTVQAQEYVDTMYLSRENGVIFLYQYRTFEDGSQAGLISGAFKVPVDSATAANYVAGQINQAANDLWAGEVRRIQTGVFSKKVTELDNLSIREFGISAKNITRDAAKPDLLTYKAETGQDTVWYWRWRLRKTGAEGQDAQIVERFSTKVLRIIVGTGSEITFTADNQNVFRFSYEGSTRYFYRKPDNPNEWVSYDQNKSTVYRLVRSVHGRAPEAFRTAQTQGK